MEHERGIGPLDEKTDAGPFRGIEDEAVDLSDRLILSPLAHTQARQLLRAEHRPIFTASNHDLFGHGNLSQ